MSLKNEHRGDSSAGEACSAPYDLVVIDVDGTLVTSRNTIPAAVVPLVEQVQAKGIGVTLASGRPRLTMTAILAELGLTLPYISAGGAFIFDPATQQELYRCALYREQVTLIVHLARAAQVAIIAQMPDDLFYEGDQATWDEVTGLPGSGTRTGPERETPMVWVPDVLQACPEPLKITLCGTPDTVRDIELALRQRRASLHLTYSAPPYLEITRVEASKGEAIKFLANYLGMALERIVAIGDSTHDLSMLQVVGTAVAMGNAAEEVKAAAHIIAPTNDEEGVAWVLREVVLAEQETGAGGSHVATKAYHQASS